MAKKFKLTKARGRWVSNRTTTMKGLALRQSITTQNRFSGKIERLVKRMAEDYERQIMKLFKSEQARKYYSTDASIGSQARILLNKLTGKYEDAFCDVGKLWSKQMIKATDKESSSTLFSSLEKLSGGLKLKTSFINPDITDVVKATVAANVSLVESIPQEYSKKITGHVMRSITQPESEGLGGLQKALQKVFDKTKNQTLNKARNTALDQTRKAFNNLNAARMSAVGLRKFEWVHSGGGQRPREYHRDVLDGEVFSLDDLPVIDEATGEHGIPGQLINCRCSMLPVIEFEDGETVE